MSDDFQNRVIGKSVQGRELIASHNFTWKSHSPASPFTLILAGVHGDEPAAYELVKRFLEDQQNQGAGAAMVWPLVNPDGLAANSRYNANGVDLNRNCGFCWSAKSEEPPGPAPWSEPENQVLRDLVLECRPAKIVTLHWALGELDADGAQSLLLLDAMWAALSETERLPYRKIAQTQAHSENSLPGSFGRWCGFAVEYPDGSRPAIVTLELPHDPRHVRQDGLPEDHLDHLRERWVRDSNGYLDEIYPGIRKMLLAACSL